MSQEAAVDFREFEGDLWVSKRQYDALQSKLTEFQHAAKLVFTSGLQELFPDKPTSIDQAAAAPQSPQQSSQRVLTREQGCSLSADGNATNQCSGCTRSLTAAE